ncbi:MAG: DeoR/GlpR transcriptional regulator, partial [Candidatus Hydrogenedentes bacterium]|nr:DeoR/GlpR transcriptional regulator [Candidatus Hydrogenedentota bacterium]
VQRLADQLQVSTMTIRRDLALLESNGRLSRTHGGAMLTKPSVVEFALAERSERHAAEKAAIARQVAAMIKPGSSVALDTGTTTLEVAKAIATHPNLTVLTSSLAVASILYTHDGIELVLLGGTARRGSPDISGWLTEQNLRQFHVDFAIVGADGVTRDGVFTTSVEYTRICQGLLAAGDCCMLLVDHSKIGKPSFSRVAALKSFDYIITDTGVPRTARKWLNTAAKNVLYARV